MYKRQFQDRFGISYEQLGLLILLNFGTQIAADVFATKYVDRLGYRRPCVAANLLSATGLICLGILPLAMPPFAGLAVATVLYAVGGGFTEVVTSPIVESCPGDEKAKAMSLLHSFYCWGQVVVVLVSTLLLKLFGHDFWFLLPLIWSVIPFVTAALFTRVPLMPTLSEEAKTPLKRLFVSKIFILAMVIMVCSGASEIAMSQWSSLFAERALQVSKVFGDLFGPCLFAVLMGVGRTVYGLYGHKMNLHKILIGSSVLCAACYLTAALAKNPVLALAACALTGLSISLMWPGMLSLTAKNYPAGGTSMFGVLAICGDIGCSAAPFLVGLFSQQFQDTSMCAGLMVSTGQSMDQLGLKFGLLMSIFFPLIMVVCLLFFQRKKKNKI